MLAFHEQRKFRRVVYATPFLIGCGVLVALLSIPVWEMYRTLAESREALAHVAMRFEKTRAREESLTREIARLRTDFGIEEEIRKRFDIGRPGERAIVIVGEDDVVAQPVRQPIPIQPPRSFWFPFF